MNLSTMRTRLRERIGNPSVTDVSDATLTLRINEALTDIADNYNFHSTKTTNSSIVTVAGTINYNLPAGVDVLITVRNSTEGTKLRKIDRNEYDELPATADRVNAPPTSYFREDGVIYLDPPPDAVYTILVRYRKALTELSADADTPGIPSSWHHGIVLLARVKYYETKEDFVKTSSSQQVFNSWVELKSDEIAEEAKVNEDGHVRIPGLETATPRLDFDHED